MVNKGEESMKKFVNIYLVFVFIIFYIFIIYLIFYFFNKGGDMNFFIGFIFSYYGELF